MFPNDAKTITISTPATGGTFCPDLLPAISTPRTLLQGIIISGGGDQAKIKIGIDDYLNNNKNQVIDFQTPVVFTNEIVSCERANNKPFQFTITYVDYDLTRVKLYEYIENETTEASFYLEKSFSYGDFFLMFFLTIFTLLGIVKIIWNKFIERK